MRNVNFIFVELLGGFFPDILAVRPCLIIFKFVCVCLSLLQIMIFNMCLNFQLDGHLFFHIAKDGSEIEPRHSD